LKKVQYLLLLSALLLSLHDAAAQGIRIGVGVGPAANALHLNILGRERHDTTPDDFSLDLSGEIDVTRFLIIGVAIRPRNSRAFTRQYDMIGNDIGWTNTQIAHYPYYQTLFFSESGVEIPLTLRYRLTSASLAPYLTGEYSVGLLQKEGQAISYVTKGGGTSVVVEELRATTVGTTVTSMTLGAGVEARVNSWFSFLMDIGWKHTFTAYVDEDFMRVREADTMTGRLMLMFEIMNAWN
jgi:hypothetical protein